MPGRPARSAEPRVTAVLNAAERVFLDRGYAAASVDEIAREAHASKATLYRHFPDKLALFAAVVRGMVERQQPSGAALDGAQPPDVALIRFAHDLITALSTPQSLALFRAVIAEAGRNPDLGRLLFHEITQNGARRLAGYLAEQTAAGTLAVPNPDLAALQLLGLVKEVLFWPRLLGLDPVNQADATISDGVARFILAYRPR